MTSDPDHFRPIVSVSKDLDPSGENMRADSGRVIELLESGQLAETSYPLPETIDPTGILVRTDVATVCGSDVHSWRGRRPFPTPSILGHEIVGEIVELGEAIETDTAGKPLSIGDRIVWTIMANCGRCSFCRVKGLPQKCEELFKYGHARTDRPPHFNGGFGEYVYVRPGTCVFRVPGHLPSSIASPLMCAGATVAAGLDTIGIEPGDDVVVQGAGLLGLYATAMANERDAGRIIVIDLDPRRLELATKFGADLTLNPETAKDLVETVRDVCDGGADVAIEVTGAPSVVPTGVTMLDIGGRYVLHGSLYPDDRFELDGHDVITKQLTIRGVHNYDATHLDTALSFVERHLDNYPFDSIAGEEFPLTVTGVAAAMKALEERESLRPAVVPE